MNTKLFDRFLRDKSIRVATDDEKKIIEDDDVSWCYFQKSDTVTGISSVKLANGLYVICEVDPEDILCPIEGKYYVSYDREAIMVCYMELHDSKLIEDTL